MLKPESKQAVEQFFASVDAEFNAFLKARRAEEYEAAAQLILESQANGGRMHITGIGMFRPIWPPCSPLPGIPAISSMALRLSTVPAASWRREMW